MTSISRSNYKPDCNLMGRANVTYTPGSKYPLQTNYHLFLTLNNLTVSKPNWKFRGAGTSHCGGNEVITQFDIYEDDEKLGSIGIDYHGRSEKIKVRNNRIDAKRERGNGYYTDDPTKAELSIRKNFFRMAKDERLHKALDEAKTLVRRETQNKYFAFNRKREAFLDKSNEFAERNLTLYLETFPDRKSKHGEFLEAEAQHNVVQSVRIALDKNESTLVVLNDAQYILQTGDTNKTCTDEELTFDQRRKIGLLKLVEDAQMISDVGCRVDRTTFVLLPEQKEQS